MKAKSFFLLTVLLCVFGLSACQATDNETQELTVFAAASLTDAFMELAANVKKEVTRIELQ